MGCASIKWSVLRAYATLRNFVAQISHSENACLRRPLVLLRQDLSASQDLGGGPCRPWSCMSQLFAPLELILRHEIPSASQDLG